MNAEDPAELRKRRIEHQKKKYAELLQKITFLDFDSKETGKERRYKYDLNNNMMPFAYFFKFLARKPEGTHAQQASTVNRLKLWIPDTILSAESADINAMWIYSSQEGYVYRTDSFTSKNIINKLGNFASPDELVAVVKKVNYFSCTKTNQFNTIAQI